MSESTAGDPYYFEVLPNFGDQSSVDHATGAANHLKVVIWEGSPAGAKDVLEDPNVRKNIADPSVTTESDEWAIKTPALYGYDYVVAAAVISLLSATEDGMGLRFKSRIHAPGSSSNKVHRGLLHSFRQNKKRYKDARLDTASDEEIRAARAGLRDTTIRLIGISCVGMANAKESAWQEHFLSRTPDEGPVLMRLLAS